MNSLRISFTVLVTSTVRLTYFKNSKLGIFIVKLLVKILLAVFIMFFHHYKSFKLLDILDDCNPSLE